MGWARRALAGALIVGVASTLLLSGPAAEATSWRTRMFHATDRSRVNHGRKALPLQLRMSHQATKHSRAMARRGYIFHTSKMSVYLRGVTWHVWGENVGVTTGSVAHLESAFMHSPEHRANILNRGFNHVAVGAIRQDGKLWVTVFFYG
jgi:uncharacterized protein YkwD